MKRIEFDNVPLTPDDSDVSKAIKATLEVIEKERARLGRAIPMRTNPEWLRKAFQDYGEAIRLDAETRRYEASAPIFVNFPDAFPHLPK